MDFFEPYKKSVKGIYHVSPKFKILKSKDLMIRGRDFYAIWDEEHERWSKDQDDAIRIIDKAVKNYIFERKTDDEAYIGDYMWDADSGVIDKWNKYVTKQMRDNYVPLDNKVIFSNSPVKREDYSTHRLNYPLEEGSISAYEELISTLYDPDERKKLEWAIGAIVSGDSTWIQKFIVIVGDPGTGKSTFFKLLRLLFPGYLATINAKALGDAHSAFALEPLKNDPLVAIEDDADLSRITDNTRLNSLVSHEPMTVNEKFKAQYENTFRAFIFLGSNKDVKITDSASGLTRRLIDVVPSGRKLPFDRYNEIMKQLPFELGGIAYHCLQVYYHNKKKYNDYIPVRMLRATNLIYNFLEEYNSELMKDTDGCRLYDLWNAYQKYCELSKVQYAHNKQEFRNELRPYFKEYYASYEYAPGQRCVGYFAGFKYEKLGLENPFETKEPSTEVKETDIPEWLILDKADSILDDYLKDYPAQYVRDDGRLERKWVNCTTKLSDIDTTKVHHVKTPENLICLDFDIRNAEGEKDRTANVEAAKTFPPTYAEWSKSGGGLHLYYIYKGDVKKLSRVYDDKVEVKVFTGDASLRRRLNGCNDIPIAEISSGLPLKGDGKEVYDGQSLSNEKAIRTVIKRNLNKEYHANTTPSVQFIFATLEKAYNNPDLKYDVTDLRPAVLNFALGSTNQSELCVKLVNDMHFKSKCYEVEPDGIITEEVITSVQEEKPIALYDVEVFKNLFIVCYCPLDTDIVIKLINPTPKEIEFLYSHFRLGGFNNRNYDAHIMYGRMMGYTNIQLYNLSQRIINGETQNAKFSEAYRLDYFDIYDFASKKQSLKKWEIELHITHLENSIPWDQEVPEERWVEIAEYCANDVLATKTVFLYKKVQADWIARQLISELSGLPVIDTNRQHITKIIFGNEKHPNLIYTDLATGKQTYIDGSPAPKVNDFCNEFTGYEFNEYGFDKEVYSEECTSQKSLYLGCDPSEGGYVFSKPGMYYNVWCFDVGGMHPASVIAMNKFGDKTKIYKEIRDARVYIKHKDYESAKKMLDGKLEKYLTNPDDAENLSKALKLILNSTYGFCAASFDNPFRDPRDKDNIVAKRGALFMITLRKKVEEMGYEVIHCKTDSIKVVNPDQRVIDFINDFGHAYGYEFEVEAKYKKICLINRAVYIAQEEDGHWSATGAEFAHPYIFKTLFTKEPLTFDDYCETKNVAKGAIYLDFNDEYADISGKVKERDKLEKKIRDGKASDDDVKDFYTLDAYLSEAHNYIFIGRIGRFVPVREGAGGGELVVKRDDKYASVAGTKGYRWMEAEVFRANNTDENGVCDFSSIDKDYYRKLCDDAIADIEQYGWFETFAYTDEDASYPF